MLNIHQEKTMTNNNIKIEDIINKIDETYVKCGSESMKDNVIIHRDGNYIKLSIRGPIGLFMYIIEHDGGYISCTGMNNTDRHGKIYDFHRSCGKEKLDNRTYNQQVIYDITQSVEQLMFFGFIPDDECDEGTIDWELYNELQDKKQMMFEIPDVEFEF